MEENTTKEAVVEQAAFIGPRKVNNLEILDVRTYEGTEVFKVNYEGGFSQVLTKTTFNLVKTEEPKDFNYVRNTKFGEVIKHLYPLIAEHFASFATDPTPEEKSAKRVDLLNRMTRILCEYDITVGETQSLLQLMTGEANTLFGALGFQMDNSFGRANNYVWTRDDKNFIPGYDQMNDITLVMAKQILDTIPSEEKKEDTVAENTNGNEAATTE